jgi:hypothetical protein
VTDAAAVFGFPNVWSDTYRCAEQGRRGGIQGAGQVEAAS